MDQKEKKFIQKVVGSLLYYAHAVDMTILHTLIKIASQQANPTTHTMERVEQLLDYMHTHPNAKIQLRALDMFLHIQSDASYLTAANAQSQAGGYFSLEACQKMGARSNSTVMS